MPNQEHKNGNSTTSLAFWLPIGAGMGAGIGAAMTTVTGQLGSFIGIGNCMVFMGVGVATGMSLVAVLAVILPKL